MPTLIMIRTKCCESFKCGNRCSICPNRVENRAAAHSFPSQLALHSATGRRVPELTPRPQKPFSRIRP